VSASLHGRTFRASVPLRTPALYRLTARGGTAARPSAAPAVYVRAVRHAVKSSAAAASGGASA